MNAVERQVNEINRLYEMVRDSNSRNRTIIIRRQIKELEDDLLEYCAWRKLDYEKICEKIFK